jgi:hypothetical protein
MTSGEYGLTKTHYTEYFTDNVESIYNINTGVGDRGTSTSHSDRNIFLATSQNMKGQNVFELPQSHFMKLSCFCSVY